MVIKYGVDISNDAIERDLKRITNLVFKLLPIREEGGDWQSPLNTLILELVGMSSLLEDHFNLFILLCKLEGLLTLTEEEDFLMFRKTIFECLSALGGIKVCQD